MVDVKISELPVAGSAAGTDQLEANQAGTSRSITVAQVGTALALTGYAPLASPVFTGDPQAPTPATADNDTSVATTAYVKAQGYLTTATAGTTYLPLAGGTLTGALTGTLATFNNTVQTATGDFANLRIAGVTKGIRFVPSSTGYAIEATDQTWGASFQPLVLNGSTVTITPPTTLSGALTGTSATFSGTVSGNGAQIQMVFTETGASATGTTLLPYDATIPQQTEGDQYMSCLITPKSATSKLIIEVVWIGSSSIANNMGAALFQDAGANAIAAGHATVASAASAVNISYRHIMTSGTTSATTFKVRAGGSVAGTTSFNIGGIYGGAMASSIVIREVV